MKVSKPTDISSARNKLLYNRSFNNFKPAILNNHMNKSTHAPKSVKVFYFFYSFQ